MEIASEKQDHMDLPYIRLIFRVIGELLPLSGAYWCGNGLDMNMDPAKCRQTDVAGRENHF